MEYIILILILFIAINTAVKLSFWRLWQMLAAGAVAALFVVLVYPYATELSKTELYNAVRSPDIMQNMAVVITLETVVFLAFAFIELKQILGKKRVSPYVLQLLHYYPGLLIYPSLFYLLAQLIFSFAGVSFGYLAYSLAATLLLLVPAAAWSIKKLLPEHDFRLEVLFITNLFTCIIGLITTVNGHTTYSPTQQPIDMRSLAILSIGFVVMFAVGYFLNKYKKQKF